MNQLQLAPNRIAQPLSGSSSRVRSLIAARPGQRGSATFEYAIVIMMCLLIIFGIVDFGRALYAYHFISNAAREGTRYASVRGNTCNLPSACPATPADITNFVKSVPQGINPASVTVTSTWTNPNTLAICGAQQNYPGCGIQVEVDYRFRFLFPLMPASFQMTSISEMIIAR
jgi:Flp pilus assembly protein TadG